MTLCMQVKGTKVKTVLLDGASLILSIDYKVCTMDPRTCFHFQNQKSLQDFCRLHHSDRNVCIPQQSVGRAGYMLPKSVRFANTCTCRYDAPKVISSVHVFFGETSFHMKHNVPHCSVVSSVQTLRSMQGILGVKSFPYACMTKRATVKTIWYTMHKHVQIRHALQRTLLTILNLASPEQLYTQCRLIVATIAITSIILYPCTKLCNYKN